MSRLEGLSVEQAVIKGKMEQKVETAKSLLNKGQKSCEIASVTGLKEDAINKIDNKFC